ncbi:class I SAM-dependent methyltransferase [Nocardioides sp. SYSU DS0663]|uniref:class I SAM-dependent methyltransferase n=1 Tax=Nocardioides sp. SYSU DS0663 TaxID=3416445 RepID=UPI003F4BF626
MADPAPPPTRWELAGPARGGYAETFARLVATGADVDGEARLADALLPRGARVLDVGSGMGRVAAALAARGHEVVAVEPDGELVAQSRRTYPDLEVVEADVLSVSPATVGVVDLVVCVGNVLVFLAEGTERRVLAHLRSFLAPGGRVLAGFHLTGGPAAARRYTPEDFVADATAAGLRVDLRAGSYELHPANDDYAVWLLSVAG